MTRCSFLRHYSIPLSYSKSNPYAPTGSMYYSFNQTIWYLSALVASHPLSSFPNIGGSTHPSPSPPISSSPSTSRLVNPWGGIIRYIGTQKTCWNIHILVLSSHLCLIHGWSGFSVGNGLLLVLIACDVFQWVVLLVSESWILLILKGQLTINWIFLGSIKLTH